MPAIDGHLPAGRDVPATAAGGSVPAAPHSVCPHLCRPRRCLCLHQAMGRPHGRAGPWDHGFGKGHPRSRVWRRGPRAGPCHSEPGGRHQAESSCPAISHAAHATGMGSSTARCQVPSNALSDLPAHCLQCHQLPQAGRVGARQALPNPLTPFPHPTPSPAFFCHCSKTPKRILKLTSLHDHNTSSALEAFRVLSPATSHSSNLKNSTKDKAGQGEAEPPCPYPWALPLACLPLQRLRRAKPPQRAAANWKMPCP